MTEQNLWVEVGNFETLAEFDGGIAFWFSTSRQIESQDDDLMTPNTSFSPLKVD